MMTFGGNNVFQTIKRRYRILPYGSRAMGNYRRGSDIDLTLYTDDTFTYGDLLNIGGEFDDSDMPYFVDVSIYGKLNNPDLKAHIDRVGKLLYIKAGE